MHKATSTSQGRTSTLLVAKLCLKRLRRGGSSRDSTLHNASCKSMQAESSRGLSATVEARNDVTVEIHHLAFSVDAQAGARVVNHGRGPGGVKGWRLNFKFR